MCLRVMPQSQRLPATYRAACSGTVSQLQGHTILFKRVISVRHRIVVFPVGFLVGIVLAHTSTDDNTFQFLHYANVDTAVKTWRRKAGIGDWRFCSVGVTPGTNLFVVINEPGSPCSWRVWSAMDWWRELPLRVHGIVPQLFSPILIWGLIEPRDAGWGSSRRTPQAG